MPSNGFEKNVVLRERLNAALNFIKTNYHLNISLSEIAETAFYEKHYFLRQFKREFKITPWRFLQEIRLKHAKDLLLDTNKKLNEISNEVGFYDQGSLSRLFKIRYGFSPTDFKKEKPDYKGVAP